MRRKMRKEFYVGLLLFAAGLLLKQFTAVPELVLGLLLALSVCLEVIGILPARTYHKIGRFKRRLFSGR